MKRYLGLCLLAMTMQTPAEPITDPLPAPKPEEPASVWDLSDLYPDVASWDDARDNATAQISAIGECEGVLDDSANVLADCLNRVSDTYKAVLRLYVYAFLNKDTNQSSIQYRERASVAQELLVEFTAATRFVKQELSQIREATLNRYLDESTRLQEHDFFIRNILRQSEHILSEEGEHVLRAASEALQSTSSTYSVLVNNDIPWPEITLSDDTKVTLDPMAYEVHRASANRNDRKQVFELFWGTYQHFRQTLALTLEGQVKKEAMIARVRGFDSSLDRALSQDNIPEAATNARPRGIPLLRPLHTRGHPAPRIYTGAGRHPDTGRTHASRQRLCRTTQRGPQTTLAARLSGARQAQGCLRDGSRL